MPDGNKRQLSDVQNDLLGLHLGLLDAEEAERLRAQADDASLKAIDDLLAPLNSYDCPVPADLSKRIDAALNKERVLSFAEANEADAVGGGSWLTSRDLLALAAAIVLFVGVFFPSYQSARDRAEQIACQGNLRVQGAGFHSYSEENDGVYPFAGQAPDDAAWARNAPTQQFSPSSRHAWRLVQLNFIAPEALSDPGDANASRNQVVEVNGLGPVPMTSYVVFDSPKAWRRYDQSPLMPLTAGMTPLVDENRNLRHDGFISQNSPNHGSDRGQNVLRLDNSVQWTPSSRAGLNKNDDIYRLSDYRDDEYTGLERPGGQTDVFLTP